MPGSFRCACPPGHTGDPFHECIGEFFAFILSTNVFHLSDLLIVINEWKVLITYIKKLNILFN
jgi:hypothetical protein